MTPVLEAILKSKLAGEECDGCDGSGIRPNSTPRAQHPIPMGFVCVERCDTCEKYASDLLAARAFGYDVRERNFQDMPGTHDVICRPHLEHFRLCEGTEP